MISGAGAGGVCVLAGPEGDVCHQVPASGGDDGEPEPGPGPGSEPGASGPPLRAGPHATQYTLYV